MGWKYCWRCKNFSPCPRSSSSPGRLVFQWKSFPGWRCKWEQNACYGNHFARSNCWPSFGRRWVRNKTTTTARPSSLQRMVRCHVSTGCPPNEEGHASSSYKLYCHSTEPEPDKDDYSTVTL